MRKIGKVLTAVTVAASTILATAQGALSDEQKLTIAGGVGILFAPIHIMKQAKLVEKHSKEAGADITLEMLQLPERQCRHRRAALRQCRYRRGRRVQSPSALVAHPWGCQSGCRRQRHEERARHQGSGSPDAGGF